jgi:hypothetical protein
MSNVTDTSVRATTNSLNIVRYNAPGSWSPNGGMIMFSNTYASNASNIIATGGISGLQTTNGSFGGGLQFWYASGNDLSVGMTILGNGNVGIGTNNPSATLHVYGAGTSASYSSYQFTIGNNSSPRNIIFGVNDTSGSIQSTVNLFNSPATAWLTLNPLGGNVGIGTNNPSYTLDVNGTFRTTSNMTCGGAYFGSNSGTTNVTSTNTVIVTVNVGGAGFGTFLVVVNGPGGAHITVFKSYNAFNTILNSGCTVNNVNAYTMTITSAGQTGNFDYNVIQLSNVV